MAKKDRTGNRKTRDQRKVKSGISFRQCRYHNLAAEWFIVNIIPLKKEAI